MLLKDKLKGSVIQSADMFYYNWFYVDDFSGNEDLTKKPYNSENLEVGLDLSVERKWDFYAQQVNTVAQVMLIQLLIQLMQQIPTVVNIITIHSQLLKKC